MADFSDNDSLLNSVSDQFDDDRSSGDEELSLRGPLEHLQRLMSDDLTTNMRSVHTFLRSWFSVLPMRKEELITSLGGSHLFFLHAESLILHILSQSFVECHRDFQMVTVFVHLERLMARFQAANGLFRLVFFKSFRTVLTQFGPEVWLLRELFMAYMKERRSELVVEFECFTSPEYKEYLVKWQPSFVMMSDEPCEDVNEPSCVAVLAHMHTTMATGIPVTFLYNLEFVGQNVVAYCITPEYGIPLIVNAVERLFLEYVDTCAWSSRWTDVSKIPATSVDFVKTASKDILSSSARFSLTAGALHLLANDLKTLPASFTHSITELVLQAIVVAQAVMDTLKVQKRIFQSHPLDTLPNGQMLTNVTRVFAGAMSSFASLSAEQIAAHADLPDALDGRVLSVVIYAALTGARDAEYFGISASHYATMYEKATGGKKLFPLDASALLKTADNESLSVPEPLVKIPKRAAPAAVEVKSFLSTTNDNSEVRMLETAEEEGAPVLDVATALKENKWNPIFLDIIKEQFEPAKKDDGAADLNGWAKRKYAMLPDHKKESFLKRIRLKRSQQQQNALRAYAKSLTGSDKLHKPIVVRENAGEDNNNNNNNNDNSDDDSDNEKDNDKDTKGGKKAVNNKKAERDAKKAEKEAKKAEKAAGKVSTRAAAIIEKNKTVKLEMKQDRDAEALARLEKRIDILSRESDLNKVCNAVYDLAVGVYRTMDLFGGFDGLQMALQLPESRAKVALMLVEAMLKAMLTTSIHALTSLEVRQAARRSLCVLFRLVNDTYSSYKHVLSGPEIQKLQETLIALGFENSAKYLFEEFCRFKVKSILKAMEQEKEEKKDEKKKHHHKMQANKDDKEKTIPVITPEAIAKAQAEVKKEFGRYKATSVAKMIAFPILPGTDAEYQLEHMPQDMDRTTGSESDPRVLFKPDRWQRKLLDVVDGKFNKDGQSESALVISPTGSGKTFICYYAMEKILRRDNESRVVYVAPSKALVLQVAAEIYARFSSKQYSPLSKVVLQGDMLKEFQNKPLECQILITVPECLEAVLFNPVDEEKQKWISCLKYVIFDEVHCIGNLGSGATWERLFQLLPCPFLALSATVGNPQSFHAWLQRVHKKPQVHLIDYNERYSDLNKYVYKGHSLVPLHTMACFNYRQLSEQGFAPDLYLTPPEALLLLRCVEQIAKEEGNPDLFPTLKDLKPDAYFLNRAITKRQFRMYLYLLKAEFLELVHSGVMSEQRFERLRDLLNNTKALSLEARFNDAVEFRNAPPLKIQQSKVQLELAAQKALDTIAEEEKEDADITEEMTEEEKAQIAAKKKIMASLKTDKSYLNPAVLIGMVRHLMELEMLPTLIFNFNRDELHRMVFSMLKKFASDQHNKYYGTDEARAKTRAINKKRMDEWEKKVRALEMNDALKSLSKREQEEQGQAYDETMGENDIGPPPGDIAEEFDSEFSFANYRVYQSNVQDVEEQFNIVRRAMSSMKARQQERTALLLDALQRGIGVHHEGTNKKYRQVVEVLFRMGYLRVVLATGTLALGVNMPCKSTVFAGDSLDVTPLMYRQMSGRAGRRGFDPLGHVVFMDFPQSTLKRLMTSRLGSLTGAYPLTPTLLLRGMQMEALCADSDRTRCRNAFRKVVGEPLCAVAHQDDLTNSQVESTKLRDRISQQVMVHLKTSFDFLFREGLVGKSGKLKGFASLLTFIYEDSPANFAIARLLYSGVLRKQVEAITTTSKEPADIKRKEELQNRQLLLILAHVMHRRTFTRQVAFAPKFRDGKLMLLDPKLAQRNQVFSAYSPCLPPLPEDVAEVLKDVDARMSHAVTESLIGTCLTAKVSSSEIALPLTKVNPVNAPFAASACAFQESLVVPSAPRVRAPLLALTGKGDEFTTPAELAACARDCVTVENSMLTPAFVSNATETLQTFKNSYILDFYVHGDVDRIKSVCENRLDATDAYNAVAGFITSLRHLTIAIEKFHNAYKQAHPEEEAKLKNDELLLTLNRLIVVLNEKRQSVAA